MIIQLPVVGVAPNQSFEPLKSNIRRHSCFVLRNAVRLESIVFSRSQSMSKESRQKSKSALLADPVFNLEQLCPAMGVAEFTFALEVATRASSLQMKVMNPEMFGVSFEEETGEPLDVSLHDSPFNRSLIGLKEHFAEAPGDFRNFAMRYIALQEILDSGRIAEWVSVQGAMVEIADSVIATAARLPLDGNGFFDEEGFVRELRQFDRQGAMGSDGGC